jgi:hypothetical protein
MSFVKNQISSGILQGLGGVNGKDKLCDLGAVEDLVLTLFESILDDSLIR